MGLLKDVFEINRLKKELKVLEGEANYFENKAKAANSNVIDCVGREDKREDLDYWDKVVNDCVMKVYDTREKIDELEEDIFKLMLKKGD